MTTVKIGIEETIKSEIEVELPAYFKHSDTHDNGVSTESFYWISEDRFVASITFTSGLFSDRTVEMDISKRNLSQFYRKGYNNYEPSTKMEFFKAAMRMTAQVTEVGVQHITPVTEDVFEAYNKALAASTVADKNTRVITDKECTNEVMMQLFVFGPTWDGNLVSKSERDTLMEAGLIERYEGWQWLNEKGLKVALAADVKHWTDQRWHIKKSHM